MTSWKIGTLTSAWLVLGVAGTMLAAPGQSRPGEATEAHVWVENRSPGQAIPVSVENTTRVEVTGAPTVALAPATTVGTRAVAQRWEYRTITVGAGNDVAAGLAGAGAENWEAFAVVPPSPGVSTGTTILLKRPR